ncbi:MAG: DUF4406 domain-containing protein [Gammaproteobacteria bacterium]|nr:DUF4406 domain-containing protein [Gammaproteobacteria bacterium]
MKYVYIAAPYTKGDVVINIRNVLEAAEALCDLGYVPFVPHLTHLWHLAIPHEINFWYQYDLDWLKKCDCLLRLEGESLGADNEITLATLLRIPIYYSIKELVEHEPI